MPKGSDYWRTEWFPLLGKVSIFFRFVILHVADLYCAIILFVIVAQRNELEIYQYDGTGVSQVRRRVWSQV